MSAIAELLAAWRKDLDRVAPSDLAAEVAAGALVVDTRPLEQRQREGSLPGAVVIDRNVLEWRLDPTSPDSIPEASSPDLRVIVVCSEGFSSSQAAYTLRQLGLRRATDLAGGFRAWARIQNCQAPDGGVASKDKAIVVRTAGNGSNDGRTPAKARHSRSSSGP